MDRNNRIFIAGHRGLVGSAIFRHLRSLGLEQLLVCGREELDLADGAAVDRWFARHKPEFVFIAAARVGGILANSTYPVEFLSENLAIQQNVIRASYQCGVQRLLFLGSSCIYPRACPQPIREEYLLTGELEPTNRAYALAKIAGIELCWAYNREYGTSFLAAMPTNLYGPGDNFDLRTSHVLPALIRKVAEAKAEGRAAVEVWGSGTPRRELLYSEDCAQACAFLMMLPGDAFKGLLLPDSPPLINIGTGEDVSIRELAGMVATQLDFPGEIVFDPSKPDGTPRKLLDISRIGKLGWRFQTTLPEGILKTHDAYQSGLARRSS